MPVDPLAPPPRPAAGLVAKAAAYLAAGDGETALLFVRTQLASQPDDPDALAVAGTACLRADRPAEAVGYLRPARRARPRDPDAGRRLGAAWLAAGRPRHAAATLCRATDGAPADAATADALARALDAAGRPAAARTLLEATAQRLPDDAGVWWALGNRRRDGGDTEGALAAYTAALAARPGMVEALNNRGLVYRDTGRPAEGEADFRAVLAVRALPAAIVNLSNALWDQDRIAEAEALLADATDGFPDRFMVWNNLARMRQGLGRRHAAETALREAVALAPERADVRANLCNLLIDLARGEDAVAEARELTRRWPDRAEAWCDLGNALLTARRGPEAEEVLHEALRHDPANQRAHIGLANAAYARNAFTETLAWADRGLDVAGDRPDPVLLNTRGIALNRLWRVAESVDAFARAAERAGRGGAVYFSNYLFGQHYLDDRDEDRLADEHRAYARRFAITGPDSRRPHTNTADPDRPLRVGYLSADYRRHPVAFFLLPLLANHDPAAVTVHGYACPPATDDLTETLRARCDAWRAVRGLSGAEVAEQVRDDGIDVLVHLNGHTSDNRLDVMALKPAPVQVEYLGYPNTSGLSCIDWRLTDARADPPGAADRRAAETLYRLPRAFHCYRPLADADPFPAPPGRAAGYVTFGSFNNAAKISDATLDAWAAILARVPDSRLLLKGAQVAEQVVADAIRDALARRGVARERVECLPFVRNLADHLKVYGLVDVALDTFPYAGTTTTCEALWAGVPVVTRAGEGHRSRVGLSLLHAVGLADTLVATDFEGYVATAAALATDTARLADVRAGLRRRLEGSALVDEAGFARDVEAAYRHMWRAWCDGPPTHHHTAPP